MGVLNATEFFTLKRLTFFCVNFTSVKYILEKTKGLECDNSQSRSGGLYPGCVAGGVRQEVQRRFKQQLNQERVQKEMHPHLPGWRSASGSLGQPSDSTASRELI